MALQDLTPVKKEFLTICTHYTKVEKQASSKVQLGPPSFSYLQKGPT